MQALITRLESGDEHVLEVVHELQSLGPPASAATDALEHVFDDESIPLHVRLAALHALSTIQSDDGTRVDLRTERMRVPSDAGDRSLPAGAAVYTPSLLAIYDRLVLGFSLRFVWKCNASRIAALYRAHMSGAHLDCGVGTGYFLAASPLSAGRVTILDVNPACLEATVRRLSPRPLSVVCADLRDPLPLPRGLFDSIGCSLVLHCINLEPGAKGDLLVRLLGLLRPGGVIFGASILSDTGDQGWLARWLSELYNRRGAFTNVADTPELLFGPLRAAGAVVHTEKHGALTTFVAHAPRIDGHPPGSEYRALTEDIRLGTAAQCARAVELFRELGHTARRASCELEQIYDDERLEFERRFAALFVLGAIMPLDEVREDLRRELVAVRDAFSIDDR